MSFQHGWGADEEGGGVVVDSAFIFRFRFMSFMVDEFQSSSGFDKRKCTYCEQQTHIQRVVDGTSFFLPPPISFFLSIHSTDQNVAAEYSAIIIFCRHLSVAAAWAAKER